MAADTRRLAGHQREVFGECPLRGALDAPKPPNRDQLDSDGDGIGDAYEAAPIEICGNGLADNGNGNGEVDEGCAGAGFDSDSDGVPNDRDNCELVPNENQTDRDADV